MTMEPYDLPSLGNGEYMWQKNGQYVRIKITETTANLKEKDQVSVRGFKGQAWQVDEAGLPDIPNPAGAVYLSQGLTIPRARIAENEDYLSQDINHLAAELAEKGLILCATNTRTASWIPND